MKLLVVTAVPAETQAVLAQAPQVEVLTGGVGPANSAAATAYALAANDYDLVLSAGICGGFAPLGAPSIAVASACVFAELGMETEDGFVPMSVLTIGTERYDVAPRLAVELADVTGGHMGTILTVATVTGSAATAAMLQERHPDAVAEAMEGAGVAAAATLRGVPFGEIRAVSNTVGPRDRAAWDIPGALEALGAAIAAVVTGAAMP